MLAHVSIAEVRQLRPDVQADIGVVGLAINRIHVFAEHMRATIESVVDVGLRTRCDEKAEIGREIAQLSSEDAEKDLTRRPISTFIQSINHNDDGARQWSEPLQALK